MNILTLNHLKLLFGGIPQVQTRFPSCAHSRIESVPGGGQDGGEIVLIYIFKH